VSVRAIVYFRKTKAFREGEWLITLICDVA